MGKNPHIFPEFWKSSVTHVKIIVCVLFYLNMLDKTQQNSISLLCGSKSFMTVLHFRLHCEILTINLTAFVKDFLLF